MLLDVADWATQTWIQVRAGTISALRGVFTHNITCRVLVRTKGDFSYENILYIGVSELILFPCTSVGYIPGLTSILAAERKQNVAILGTDKLYDRCEVWGAVREFMRNREHQVPRVNGTMQIKLLCFGFAFFITFFPFCNNNKKTTKDTKRKLTLILQGPRYQFPSYQETESFSCLSNRDLVQEAWGPEVRLRLFTSLFWGREVKPLPTALTKGNCLFPKVFMGLPARAPDTWAHSWCGPSSHSPSIDGDRRVSKWPTNHPLAQTWTPPCRGLGGGRQKEHQAFEFLSSNIGSAAWKPQDSFPVKWRVGIMFPGYEGCITLSPIHFNFPPFLPSSQHPSAPLVQPAKTQNSSYLILQSDFIFFLLHFAL